MIIAFLKDDKGDSFGECPEIDTDFVVSSIDGEMMLCYNELISYVQVFFIVFFVMRFVEILVPWIMGKLLNRKN